MIEMPKGGEMSTPIINKPIWWPKCPYSEGVWSVPWEEYVRAVPNPKLREIVAHFLMREGWKKAEEDIWKSLKNGTSIYDKLRDVLLSEE